MAPHNKKPRTGKVLQPKAKRQTMHGTLVRVHGCGILLAGKSGIGKSESALDLITRGHQLIADDAVIVYRRAGALIGTSVPHLNHHLEVRGIGIVDVNALYGAGAVGFSQQIHAVVELVAWSPRSVYERSGLDQKNIAIAGVTLLQYRIPLACGRTVASTIEAIALTILLRLRGINSAEAFNQELISTMQTHGRHPAWRPPKTKKATSLRERDLR
jgi:HPr kinase/phosphorylase